MIYNFDEIIDRRNTISSKWDNVGARIGNANALPMWVADMDFRCPQPVIDAVKKRAEFGLYAYPYLPPRFKTVTCEWISRRHGWSVEPETVVFSSGIIPAMYNLIQAFTQPGEKVILQRPVYYPFTNSIVDNGRIVSNNALILKDGRYEMDFDDLERRCADPDTHLMLLCNPHNPTGRVYTEEELRLVGEICLRHNVLIFADEIHSDFIYPASCHTPLASLSPELAEITITAIAPSKSFNVAGLRSAALIITNPELRKRMESQLSRNRAALPSTFGIDGYIAAYESGDEYLEQLLVYLRKNVEYLDQYLKVNMPKISLIQPEGTYLMWLDCRALGLSNEALDRFFIDEALVACDKGYWFGSEGSGFMRMNIGCPRATIEQALSQLQKEYDRAGF